MTRDYEYTEKYYFLTRTLRVLGLVLIVIRKRKRTHGGKMGVKLHPVLCTGRLVQGYVHVNQYCNYVEFIRKDEQRTKLEIIIDHSIVTYCQPS
jgi:hypothetical protein